MLFAMHSVSPGGAAVEISPLEYGPALNLAGELLDFHLDDVRAGDHDETQIARGHVRGHSALARLGARGNGLGELGEFLLRRLPVLVRERQYDVAVLRRGCTLAKIR